MKRMIVGTALGRIAMSVRESIGIFTAAYSRLEIVGLLANDRLAGVLVTRLCQKNKAFIDVGAHIGSVISEVIHHTPSARIIAVEAIPEKSVRLRRKFRSAEIHACALGDSEGEAVFFVHKRHSGYSSLGRPTGANESDVTEIRVPVRRMDDLVSPNGIDVMKIDVEGAELGVLRGAERLVAASRPTILFESGPPVDDGLGYTKNALWEWFAERSYAVLVPNRVAHNDPGLGRDGFLESHIYPRRTTNYFAVANERRIEIRDRARGLLNIPVT